MTMVLYYLSFFILSLSFSLLINTLFYQFSKNLGVRQNEDIIRWTTTRKPSIGGLTFYMLFLFSITIYSVFFDGDKTLLNISFLGVFLVTTLGFLIGLADDAYNTNPLLKFLAQLSCGIILCFCNLKIQLFDYDSLNYIITFFWVVGLMNSINMLDNMDAITTLIGVSILIISALFLYRTGITNDIYLFVVIGVLSSLLGFLFFNWNPSKMYMGDTGSQFLGVLLAALGIKFFWNSHEIIKSVSNYQKTIAAILVFLIPIIDTTTVFINRIMKGGSPFVGGKDHTTHSLVRYGFSQRQVAILYFIISLFSGFLIFPLFFSFPLWTFKHTLFFSAYVALVFVVLYSVTKLPENKDA